MKILDLHNYHVDEALRKFISFYNDNFNKNEEVKIIHGYGTGGKIKKALRKYFDLNSKYLEYMTGEEFEANLGTSIVKMKKKLPDISNVLRGEIKKFCIDPKTVEKISGNFRKYSSQEIKKALNYLVNNKEISLILKGKHKCYKSN